MKRLKSLIIVLLILSVIAVTIFQFRSEIKKSLSYSDCDKPISYKLGALDPKFGLSQATILSDIQDATDIWSKAYGKPLFVNSPTAKLTIDFVYDQRSALITQIDQMENQLNQKNMTLRKQITSYESDLAAYEKKLNDFNSQVDQVNRSGGATPALYKKLIAQQKELAAEGDSLNARASQLSLSTHDFNSVVQSLNQNVDKFNQSIEQKPEEGLYDPNDNIITIYFADKDLIHTLAHEFGHALGMLHTSDTQSIMYTYTTSYLVVTPQDKQQLDYICRVQSLPVLWSQEFSIWLHTTLGPVIPN